MLSTFTYPSTGTDLYNIVRCSKLSLVEFSFGSTDSGVYVPEADWVVFSGSTPVQCETSRIGQGDTGLIAAEASGYLIGCSELDP